MLEGGAGRDGGGEKRSESRRCRAIHVVETWDDGCLNCLEWGLNTVLGKWKVRESGICQEFLKNFRFTLEKL